jgi:hypothetical protein
MPPRLHPAQTPNSICLLFVVSSASSPQSSRQQQMYPVLCCSVSLSLKDPGRGTMRAPASRDGVKPWRKAAKNVPCKRAPRGFFCMAVGTGRRTALGLRIAEELFGRVTLSWWSEQSEGVSRGAQYRRVIGRWRPPPPSAPPLPPHPRPPPPISGRR